MHSQDVVQCIDREAVRQRAALMGFVQAKPTAGQRSRFASGSETASSPAGGASVYFTTEGNTVTEPVERSVLTEVAPCRCKSRFCSRCCRHLGIVLLEKLKAEIETWSGVKMLSLTQDPKHYECDAAPAKYRGQVGAYRYAREKRVVARLVRKLYREGFLHSEKWVVIVEWQKNSEMAHYHLLVEASFIPVERMRELWGKFRPKWLPKYDPSTQAPVFGHAWISKDTFADPRHAACYVCKYVTKTPAHGYPEWVMDFTGKIRRFATSRGLFPGKDKADRASIPEGEEATKKKSVRTIRERVQACGDSTILVQREWLRFADGRTLETARKFVRALPRVPFQEAIGMTVLGTADSSRVPLLPGELDKLTTLNNQREQRASSWQHCRTLLAVTRRPVTNQAARGAVPL